MRCKEKGHHLYCECPVMQAVVGQEQRALMATPRGHPAAAAATAGPTAGAGLGLCLEGCVCGVVGGHYCHVVCAEVVVGVGADAHAAPAASQTYCDRVSGSLLTSCRLWAGLPATPRAPGAPPAWLRVVA